MVDYIADQDIIMVHYTDDKGQTHSHGVLFINTSTPGMVGETIENYLAYQVVYPYNSTPKIYETPLEYSTLREIYKRIKGRTKRIKFWSWLIHFTPEARKLRAEEVKAEIDNMIR